MKDSDLIKVEKQALKAIFEQVLGDGVIDQHEHDQINSFLAYSALPQSAIAPYQDTYNRCRLIGCLDEGCIPEAGDMPIAGKKGEVLHWYEQGGLVKVSSRTSRISYGGLMASVKVAPGVRYRMGSLAIAGQKETTTEIEDRGGLWISNMRIGFKGNSNNFNMPINKVEAIELGEYGLYIFKAGRQKPTSVKVVYRF